MNVFKDRVLAAILGGVVVVGAGFWLYIHQIRTTRPPELILPPPKPLPPDTGWTRVIWDTIAVPGTDSYCEVAAWIPNGADRYRAGETLTIVVGMRHPYQAPLTMVAPDTMPLVNVKVILQGYGSSVHNFSSIDSMVAYYSYHSRPSAGGWAIAWEPSDTQLRGMPRRVTIPVMNETSPEWMGREWTEVARVEVPCDRVTKWDWSGEYGSDPIGSMRHSLEVTLAGSAKTHRSRLYATSARREFK